MSRGFVLSLWCVLGAALVACGDDDGGGVEVRCGLAFTGADVQGSWSLRAHGTRSECSDADLNGDLSIETADPIVVDGTKVDEDAGSEPSEADAFVNRIIVRTGFDLMGESLPAKLMFDGSSDGSCVTFTLVESLGRGDELTYQFEGYISESGIIEGNFSGTGPDDCEVSGEFTVEVR